MRLADTAPAYCSGCFQSKPESQHVDFDVAWDGPTVQEGLAGGEGEIVQTVAITIDDLILCTECLTNAAKLIGLADQAELEAKIVQLEEANRNLAERLRGQEDYTSKLQAAVTAKPNQRRKPAGVS